MIFNKRDFSGQAKNSSTMLCLQIPSLQFFENRSCWLMQKFMSCLWSLLRVLFWFQLPNFGAASNWF